MAVVVLLAALDERFRHFFLVPVAMAGILTGADASRWVRRDTDLFDAGALVAGIAFYFMFVTPLLHVHLDYWMKGVAMPPDWRTWLGWMAVINAFSYGCYMAARRLWAPRAAPSGVHARARTVWHVKPTAGLVFICVAFIAAACAQLWLYGRVGGLGGYLAAFDARASDANPFLGTGWIVTIAESGPILFVLGFIQMAVRRPSLRRWSVIGAVLVLCAFLLIFFGGLRGSRANILWNMFWAVGIVHLTLRKVPKWATVAFAVVAIFFMYSYGFYKSLGSNAWTSVSSISAARDLGEETGRTFSTVLLGDLGRSDVQAYLLYQTTSPQSDYSYAWGRTYVGALALVIPERLWPNRPVTKVKEGTDAQYGAGTFDGGFKSSRIYGLSGEALLNFGYPAIPVAFLLFGLFVSTITRTAGRWEPQDARRAIMPLLTIVCILLLVSDSDNVVWIIVKYGAVPAAVIFFSSSRLRHRGAACVTQKPGRRPAVALAHRPDGAWSGSSGYRQGHLVQRTE
jgi:hypothetical protein